MERNEQRLGRGRVWVTDSLKPTEQSVNVGQLTRQSEADWPWTE